MGYLCSEVNSHRPKPLPVSVYINYIVSSEEVSGPVLAAVVIDIVVVVILTVDSVVETVVLGDVTTGALVVVTHSGL